MIYTFLISLVFIAEIIITITIIQNLFKLDKAILSLNETITLAKSGIKDIAVLSKNISFQIVELANKFVHKIKNRQEDMILRQLSKILLTLILFKINSKTINKFRKSRYSKTLAKGLSFLENMV